MKRVINLDNWNRKEHFKFFSALDDPFWGITTTVDFTSIYQQSKNMEVSFFLYSVHFLLKCINATTAFKLRIENGEVVEYDKINISPTIGREDGTFGVSIRPRACFFPLFSFLPLWLHYNLNPLCVQY